MAVGDVSAGDLGPKLQKLLLAANSVDKKLEQEFDATFEALFEIVHFQTDHRCFRFATRGQCIKGKKRCPFMPCYLVEIERRGGPLCYGANL